MRLMERVKDMLRSWLKIRQAPGVNVTIREAVSWETNCVRNRIWYRGDADEIEQLFKAIGIDGAGGARFWAAAPVGKTIRKAHSGLPAIMVDTLAYLVKSDLGDVSFGAAEGLADRWQEMARGCDFPEVVGDAVAATLALGDGAFKISIDPEFSDQPILEFWPADKVTYCQRHGKIVGVDFCSSHTVGDRVYELKEEYRPGAIRYRLFDGDKEVPLSVVPELSGYAPVDHDGDFPMAIPFCVYKSQKWPGRGRSIFDNKTDAFDAHDEVISQWIEAVRSGRVQKYIPEDLIPRDETTGALRMPDSFGCSFVKIASSNKENANDKIDTVQPEIRYEAFLASYGATLDMCLQGIMSPATLGVGVGKMASAEAQRERKDVTGYTRNAVTDALEKVLPQVVRSMLMAQDAMHGRSGEDYEPQISFGEYGAPDFDSRVQTVGSAAGSGVMSVEAQVEELWGSSKDDAWKKEEVARIRFERGIEELPEPDVGNGV